MNNAFDNITIKIQFFLLLIVLSACSDTTSIKNNISDSLNNRPLTNSSDTELLRQEEKFDFSYDTSLFKNTNGNLFNVNGNYHGSSIMGYSVGVAQIVINKNKYITIGYNHLEHGSAQENGILIPKSNPILKQDKDGVYFYEIFYLFQKADGGNYDVVICITDTDLKEKAIKSKPVIADNENDDSIKYIPDDDNRNGDLKGEVLFSEEVKPVTSKIIRTIILTGNSWKVNVQSSIEKSSL